MPSVFLSHSSKDKPFVRELAEFLAREGGIKVWLDEGEIAPGQNIVDRIAEGLDSDFILLVLSPDSVASAWVQEEWTDAFWEQTNNRKTKLVGVLYRDCQIPRLLRNKKYFDLRTNQPQGFREIRTFLLTERPVPPGRVNQLPVRPPLFVGREEELANLRERLQQPGALVHVPGMPGMGKTTLALEFAHRYQGDYEAVYWLPCQSGSLSWVAGELARQLGLKLEGDLPEIVRELKGVCANKRCLLILDNVEDQAPGELVPGGAASVLVTTRRTNLPFLRFHPPLALPLFTEEQCFDLFRRQLGPESVARQEAECRQLFGRLGRLPIGVSVSAGLIRYDVRYTIAGLASNPPADVDALIREAMEALDPAARTLLAAMSACAPEGFGLDLASAIAGLDEEGSLAALQVLVERSLAEEVDRTGRRYRLHAMVRGAAGGEAFGRQHAGAVHRHFETWEENWQLCELDLPDFQVALEWALGKFSGSDADFSAESLAYRGFLLTRRIGRLTDAFEICRQMTRAADQRQDSANLQAWVGNQAVIFHVWGRLDEALELLNKQEDICLQLGNKDGLQRSYANQAVILWAWGGLDEALALHKKQEDICLQLGNKDGLQRSYGNQAIIFQAWGRLDEALALLKKQENICLQLGNKDGLQASYGNQALILQVRGRLDEALALLKKQEDICLQLGNKDSLQRSYGNQAVILQVWGRLDEALALLKKQEDICLQLGNKDGLAVSYGNQALILKDWGRLDEALALLKKQEAICLELRINGSLGYCYWNWGLLERARDNSAGELQKLSAALAIFQELQMPRERDAVQAELAKP